MMMVGTILGPGTIFLMLVGAFSAAFGIANWDSFLYNLIPILGFMVLCFVIKKTDIQLFVAQLLSAGYALVMMAVMVGIILQVMIQYFRLANFLPAFQVLYYYLPTINLVYFLDQGGWPDFTKLHGSFSSWWFFYIICHYASSRILVSSLWNRLLYHYSCYVFVVGNLLYFQFKCGFLGNSGRT